MIASNIPLNILKLQDKKDLVINLGCGDESYGDIRIDFVKTPTTTHVYNLNRQLPFYDETFTEVYCKSVLEHIKDLGFFLNEVYRILKQNGKFWFRTDNASYLPFLFKNHQHYIERIYEHHTAEDKHYYLFKEEHLRNIFDKFEIEEISFTCPNNKLFFLPKKLKCMHIEIKGRKCN